MIKYVIFDFDGTIADTFKATFVILNQLAKKYGYDESTPEQIEQYRSKTIQEICNDLHIPLIKLPFILNDFKAELKSQIAQQLPISGIRTLVDQLRQQGFSLSIITSNSKENVETFLTAHQIHFDTVYSSSSIFGKDKTITKFLKAFSIDKKEAIYVGDEIRDIDSAHKAGLNIISVTWGFNSEQSLMQNAPDFLVNKPEEIVAVLKRGIL